MHRTYVNRILMQILARHLKVFMPRNDACRPDIRLGKLCDCVMTQPVQRKPGKTRVIQIALELLTKVIDADMLAELIDKQQIAFHLRTNTQIGVYGINPAGTDRHDARLIAFGAADHDLALFRLVVSKRQRQNYTKTGVRSRSLIC